MLPLIYSNFKNPKKYHALPETKIGKINKNRKTKIIFGWIIYLLGYEILFRGIFLFPLAAILGVWPAIAINTLFYSGSHIPKGIKEAIPAIPFGIILCLITLLTGSILAAFIIHLGLALTSTFASIKFKPKIKK